MVAAAVTLSLETAHIGLGDSKSLSKQLRQNLFKKIKSTSDVGLGVATVEEIDELNILQATMLAMQRAFYNLKERPEKVLIDGNQSPNLDIRTECIIKGDSKIQAISAASIIAKVSRDEIMSSLAILNPGYGWERNAGYGTAEHKTGIAKFGISPQHRRSYAPIKQLMKLSINS